MDDPTSPAPVEPNLWHFSAMAWGFSNMLLSLFAWPLCFNQTGIRLQLCLLVVHIAGVTYLWRVAKTRGNPERLLDMAFVTLVFIFMVPLCMLAAPVMVLAAYALPGTTWQAVATIFAGSATVLAIYRIWRTATDDESGRRFDLCLINELQGRVLTTISASHLLSRVGSIPTKPTRIDGWSMIAAVATGAPILLETISHNATSRIIGLCALITTPLAMHTVSRLAVHAYLWIYRLARFERESGIRILVTVLPRD